MKNRQKSKNAGPDGKAHLFLRTQLCHHISLLIGLADEGGGG